MLTTRPAVPASATASLPWPGSRRPQSWPGLAAASSRAVVCCSGRAAVSPLRLPPSGHEPPSLGPHSWALGWEGGGGRASRPRTTPALCLPGQHGVGCLG